MNKRWKIKDIVLIAVLISFCVVLSLFDSYISNLIIATIPFIGVVVPNFKLGLANVVILIIILNYDFKTSICAVLLKVLIVGLYNPNGIPMSFGGSFLSFMVMEFLFRLLGKEKNIWFISGIGGLTHSLGQIIFGFLYYGLIDIKNIVHNHIVDVNILIYSPLILIAGLITGIIMGIIAKKLNIYISKYVEINNGRNKNNMKVIYVGHRGSKVNGGVENTKEAFLGGAQVCQALECDVRVTKDHKFVIFHDNDVTRLTKESKIPYTYNVNNENYDVLQSIELTQVYNDTTYHGHICLFEEYLEICKKNHLIPVIELKWTNGIYSDNQNSENFDYSNLDQLVELIKKYDLFESGYVMTSMRGCLNYLRKKYPSIKLQWLCTSNVTDYLDWAIENNINIDVEHNYITKEIVEKCHEHNLIVNIWTMNDASLLDKYLEMGVDMITSDWIVKKQA